MPKGRHGFLNGILLYLIESDPVQVISAFRAADIVI